MHFIRFLKSPRVVATTARKPGGVECKITITTDLGEAVLDEDVTIIATLYKVSSRRTESVTQELRWRTGMRALEVSFRRHQDETKLSHVTFHMHVTVPAARAHSAIVINAGSAPHIYNPVEAVFLTISSVQPLAIVPATSGSFSNETGPERVLRSFGLARTDRQLRIWEDTGSSIARHIWDAGVILTAFITRCSTSDVDQLKCLQETMHRGTQNRLRVLELGCGCGIVGIAISQLLPNAEVILSDLGEAREIAKHNLVENNIMPPRCIFVELDWEEETLPEQIKCPLDLIIVADCIYNPDSAPALVNTLSRICTHSPQALVVMATKLRHPSEAVFFHLMREAQMVQIDKASIPLPSAAALDKMAEQEHVDIYLFRSRAISA